MSGLAATDFSPSWSPDGTQLVFHSGRETTFTTPGTTPINDFEIYKMSAVTGETPATPAVRLTESRGQDAIPSWSPDSTKIAFQSLRRRGAGTALRVPVTNTTDKALDLRSPARMPGPGHRSPMARCG